MTPIILITGATQQLTAALPDVMTNSMCPGWCRTEMGGI
jgi:NAD(P)-dependent dehydrogenase (short-subunit alcohol dehydrogenase family)